MTIHCNMCMIRMTTDKLGGYLKCFPKKRVLIALNHHHQTSVSLRSEEQIESEATARQQQETADLEEDEEEIALQKKKNVEVVSNALVTQDFLLDQDKTVGEVMIENGIEVRDFVRFEIGKGIDMDE